MGLNNVAQLGYCCLNFFYYNGFKFLIIMVYINFPSNYTNVGLYFSLIIPS